MSRAYFPLYSHIWPFVLVRHEVKLGNISRNRNIKIQIVFISYLIDIPFGRISILPRAAINIYGSHIIRTSQLMADLVGGSSGGHTHTLVAKENTASILIHFRLIFKRVQTIYLTNSDALLQFTTLTF